MKEGGQSATAQQERQSASKLSSEQLKEGSACNAAIWLPGMQPPASSLPPVKTAQAR